VRKLTPKQIKRDEAGCCCCGRSQFPPYMFNGRWVNDEYYCSSCLSVSELAKSKCEKELKK
jgi:hypothetical protein